VNPDNGEKYFKAADRFCSFVVEEGTKAATWEKTNIVNHCQIFAHGACHVTPVLILIKRFTHHPFWKAPLLKVVCSGENGIAEGVPGIYKLYLNSAKNKAICFAAAIDSWNETSVVLHFLGRPTTCLAHFWFYQNYSKNWKNLVWNSFNIAMNVCILQCFSPQRTQKYQRKNVTMHIFTLFVLQNDTTSYIPAYTLAPGA